MYLLDTYFVNLFNLKLLKMFNATVAGNLTGEAISREVSTAKGTIYAIRFTIAINEKYGDKENATFLPCTYWSKSNKIAEHLTKGKAVIVQIDWYSNNEKEGKYYQEFRVKKINFQRGEKAAATPSPSTNAPSEPSGSYDPFEDDDDDLPF